MDVGEVFGRVCEQLHKETAELENITRGFFSVIESKTEIEKEMKEDEAR